ncbi:MAG: hypothetical protein MZW92_33015 [Comamonadaceae bacterium]|nr:hypothetical protein [Comamonadaceae bacterium]
MRALSDRVPARVLGADGAGGAVRRACSPASSRRPRRRRWPSSTRWCSALFVYRDVPRGRPADG